MKNAHKATRPVWALHSVEVVLSMCLAIFLSAAATTFLTGWIRAELAPRLASRQMSESEAAWVLDAVTTIALTTLSLVAIWVYKKVKTRHYSGTYVYCFKQTEPVMDNGRPVLDHHGNPLEKVVFSVVGSFELKVLPDGGFSATGNAWQWENGLQRNNLQIGWTSQHVGTTEYAGTTKCFIIYTVNEEERRPYTHGLIEFEVRPRENGIVAREAVYRGRIHGIDPPNGKVPFYAHAYAERIGKVMSDRDRVRALEDHGAGLITRLQI
jgi:hypothetical protein